MNADKRCVQLAAQPRWIRGLVLGLQQPCALAQLQVQALPDAAAARVRDGLQQLIAQPAPTVKAGDADEQIVAMVLHAACAVQRQARIAVAPRSYIARGAAHWTIAVPSVNARAAGRALDWALGAVDALSRGAAPASLLEGLARAVDALRPYADAGPGPYDFVREAMRQDVPFSLRADGVTVFGTGRHARWLAGMLTDRTNALGASVALGGADAMRALRGAGLPAPVTDADAQAPIPATHRLTVFEGHVIGIAGSGPRQALHPDNLRLAVDAARVLRLDFASVDITAPDGSRSWIETGGRIVGIQARPALHDASLAAPLLQGLMRGGVRIPARLVLCPAGDAGIRALQVAVEAAGDPAHGVAAASGLRIGGRRVTATFDSGFSAARALLLRDDAHEATCLMSPAEVMAAGTPLDRWDSVTLADAAWPDADAQAARQALKLVRAGA